MSTEREPTGSFQPTGKKRKSVPAAHELRAQYESGFKLGLLHSRISKLIDQAENLLGIFDELERLVANAERAARHPPQRKKGKR